MAKKRKLEAVPTADRGELRRLLEAAKADHWDDGPRLALADWLEEHGGEADRARAEVIRLQLDAENGGPLWRLTVEKLREKHIRDWVGAAHRAFFRVGLPLCSRGLLDVYVGASKWAGDAGLDDAWHWVETATPAALAGADMAALLGSARLSTVSRLLLNRQLSAQQVRAVLAHLQPGQLRAVHLVSHYDTVAEAARSLRPGLDELGIVCYDQQADWRPLIASEGMTGLRSFSPSFPPLRDADAAGLATAPGLRTLSRLSADGRLLTATGLASLANLPLRRLSLTSRLVGLSALAALQEGPCGSTLEELDVRGWPRQDGLPASLRLPRLRRLSLSSCQLVADDLRALAETGIIGRLDSLNLSSFDHDRAALSMDALTASGTEGPRSLLLLGCRLGDDAVVRLAAWSGLARVRRLDLAHNDVGEVGLRALAESPHASSLVALDLSYNPRAGFAELFGSPLGSRLTCLGMGEGTPGPALARALVEAAPPQLREVYLSWRTRHGLGRGDRARLRAAIPWCATD
jgi:uncharacterized protein (TIGR02996 family)